MRMPITTTSWMRPLLLLAGATAGNSYVDVSDDQVRIRLGFAFDATFPTDAVQHIGHLEGRTPYSIGAHGWRGRWLVNGARRPLVTIDLDPTQRARVLGVPVKLHQLTVSVDDPDALIDRLAQGETTGR